MRVLIVEDSENDATLVAREIRRSGREVVWERVETANQMRAALKGRSWDAVLADYSMPHFSAPAALKLLQEAGLDLPFIVVSGTVGEDVAVETMRAGAHDYILKGSLTRLVPAIEREIAQAGERRARRQAEEQAAAILRTAIDGFYLTDADGRILEVNDSYCRLSGYSRDELLAMRVTDVEAVETPEDFARHAHRIREMGEHRFETRHRRKDGQTVELEASVKYLREADRFISFMRDITERKQVQQTLEASEARFRAVVASAPAAIVVAQAGKIVLWNQGAERLFQYSQQEAMDQPAPMLIPGPYLTQHGEAVQRFHASGETHLLGKSYEAQALRKDGSQCPVQVSLAVWQSAQGTFASAIITDITELKRAEEVSARFLAGSPAVIYALLLAPEGFRVSWFSENIQSLTGYTGAEVRAGDPERWWEQGIHPDDLPRVVAANQAVLDEGQAMVEFRFRRKDGSWLWVHDEKRVLFDPENGPSEVVGSWMDVTARMRLEEQFLQAQKMEAVGRLAGGIAHDFNNILTVIGGYSEVLVKTLPEGEPAQGHATEIRLAARRAAALTRQLLAFSRKQVLELKVLDVNTIVSGMLGLLSRLLGEDVEIVLELQTGLGLVKADPGQIEQVIMNLAVNARDAMPQDGKLILETQDVELDESYARAHPSVAAGPYVLLAASDTGCGMTPETVSHVFEPFFTTKEMGKGTGLGLSTVFGIVKQSGGEISVYSVPGEGTTFKIYLPRVSAEAGESKMPSSPTILRAHPGETVLMIEDDEAVARLTQSMLRDLGYEVLAATRGEEALETASHHPGPIHLLLTDVVMPGIRGPEVATRLLAVRPETRVVFMSGYAEELVLNHAAVQGTALFLQKPFTSFMLGGKLREALDAVALPEQQGAGVHGGRKPLSILQMDDDKDILEITSFFLAEDGHHVVGCVDVDETVARYAEALARGERFDLVILDLTIPGKRGGVEGMREILKLDPTARIVACSGAGPGETGQLESGFIGIVEKPFTPESLKAIRHLL